MGVNLLYGRDFSTGEADYQKSAIISENLCSLYGWKSQDALNKQIKIDTLTYSVIGVTKNIYMGGFFNRLEPILMVKTLNQDYANLIIKAKVCPYFGYVDRYRNVCFDIFDRIEKD